MAMVLKGKEVQDALNERTTADAQELKSKGIEPCLAVLRVGERSDDISYEKTAMKRAEALGIATKSVVLPMDVSEDALINEVLMLNADDSVHGVLMFRPLPEHIDEDRVRNMLSPAKDIDGLTDLSLAGVFAGIETGFAPCTAAACMEILDYYDVDCKGKNAVVVGRSLVVGKPAAMMLLDRNATVTIAHSRTADLLSVVRQADIVIAAVGRFKMLDAGYFTEGQIVVDVGINFNDEGEMAGDVNYEEVEGIVSAITPVPGGVGTVTTSVLLKHVVEAAKRVVR
jgi:methylenetetrahydrofolate dehydrogenase (NADP+)/methenyltetrahydrofolate cyclohydrolase